MAVTPTAGLRRTTSSSSTRYDLARRHRAQRHRPAPAIRAPRGQGGRAHRRRSTRCSAPAPTSRCWPASSHVHKVNFCKFTNETRNAIEDAGALLGSDLDRRRQRHRGRRRLRARARLRRDPARRRPRLGRVAPRGPAARRAPRHRRADARWSTSAMSAATSPTPSPPRPRGSRASRRSIGASSTRIAPRSAFDERGPRARPRSAPAESDRPAGGRGIELTPLDGDDRTATAPAIDHVDVASIASSGAATITVHGPPARRRAGDAAELVAAGAEAGSWPPLASSTTRSSTCGSTSQRSARGCCATWATPTAWRPRRRC